MWVSTHVVAGLAIAAALGGPWWLILILVILAHVLMDLIPHWDYTASRHPLVYGWIDSLSTVVFFFLAWKALGYPWWIALMGLVSGAPDWDVLISMLRGDGAPQYFPSHWDRFPHGKSGPVWGIGVQVVIMVVSVGVVVALRP